LSGSKKGDVPARVMVGSISLQGWNARFPGKFHGAGVCRVLCDPMGFEPVDEFGNETIAGIILGGSLQVPGLLLGLTRLLV